MIVPPASKLADLEQVRTAIRTRRALLVADFDRVILEGGFQMRADRSFARSTAAAPAPAPSPETRTVRTATPAARVLGRYFASSQSTPAPTSR